MHFSCSALCTFFFLSLLLATTFNLNSENEWKSIEKIDVIASVYIAYAQRRDIQMTDEYSERLEYLLVPYKCFE